MKSDFDFSSKDLKHYPHFDAPISMAKIEKLVTDPKQVAANTFFPFMLYEESWQPFRSSDLVKPERKSRPIRYGARRDAYIFTHYRRKLSKLYEEELQKLGIENCPIAYRHIPKADSTSGKCNIDFAKDAFDEIDSLENCVAIALDIKSYFDNLDHARIKKIWCDLLGTNKLPDDHYAVFRNITKYHYVDQIEVYRRLGYFGPITRNGKTFDAFTRPYKEIPKQLCSPTDFRDRVCGGNSIYGATLVKKNEKPYGIPQGSPISDLIANFYLLEFDKILHDFANERGGFYMRYSDDILLILPGDESEIEPAIDFASRNIQKFGDQLKIKNEKTCVTIFEKDEDSLTFKHIKSRDDEPNKNGFEYLGFRYDGKRIYLRDSTVSRFFSKVAVAANMEAIQHIKANPNQNCDQLIQSFDYSLLSQRFGKVKRQNLTDDYRSWTFYSYLKRATDTFGKRGERIPKQIAGFNKFMRKRVESAILRKAA